MELLELVAVRAFCPWGLMGIRTQVARALNPAHLFPSASPSPAADLQPQLDHCKLGAFASTDGSALVVRSDSAQPTLAPPAQPLNRPTNRSTNRLQAITQFKQAVSYLRKTGSKKVR